MAVPRLTKTLHHTVYPAISPSNPLNSAHGKTVIISGGGSGIGYSIAQSFAAAGAATVVLIARRQSALDSASTALRAEIAAARGNTQVWTYLFDLTDELGVSAAFANIRQRLNEGNPPSAPPRDAHILITSAANMAQGHTTLDFPASTYTAAFATNLLGNLNLVRAFLALELPAIPVLYLNGTSKQTVPSPHPHPCKIILDVSSIGAYAIIGGITTYAASKLAFTRAMSQLQSEVDGLPGQPVRIHSFHPGMVRTPEGSKALAAEGEESPLEFDDESLPGGFAVWLASPAAAFLKGRFVFSNWDVDELVALKHKYNADAEYGTITLKI